MQWYPSEILPSLPVTQVSGFIFDKEKRLLLVKNKSGWTLPGGKPESNEQPLDTLYREVLEEASVSVSDPKFLGFVKVTASGSKQVFSQLRYIALLRKSLAFADEYETSERIFVKLNELENYISYYNGKTFKLQLESALSVLRGLSN